MKICPSNDRCAFTLMEGVVLVTVVALLLVSFLTLMASRKIVHSKINCINNVKQVGIAFQIWQRDYNNKYPMNVPAALGGAQELIATGNVAACFQVMSNELSTPRILNCPEDFNHTFAASFETNLTPGNLSYFIGLTTTNDAPLALLSGDANLVQNGRPVPSGMVSLLTNTAIWTNARHRGLGNVLTSDGSVQPMAKIGFTSPTGTWFATNQVVVP